MKPFWIERFGMVVDHFGTPWVRNARAALLDHLPKDLILACYYAAPGRELESDRFKSDRSSAALVANAFGLFLARPDLLSLPTPLIEAGSAMAVTLEAQMRFPWGRGRHPWLDAAVETDDALIGVESKRYEPFCDPHKVKFSAAYSRDVWGNRMTGFEAMRDALTSGQRAFSFLDAAQLVKHAFGLRTEAARRGKVANLLYLYAEPSACPDGRPVPRASMDRHRTEVAAFGNLVGTPTGDVLFSSLCYADLQKSWQNSPDGIVRSHAEAVIARFDRRRGRTF